MHFAGDFTAFFLLYSQIWTVYNSIYDQYLLLVSQLPEAEKVVELMGKKSCLVSGPLQPASLTGRVEFRNVRY